MKLILVLVLIGLVSFVFGSSLATGPIKPMTKTTDTQNIPSYAPSKSGQPELKFFVMSFCPYGNQMEDTLRPVFDLLGNKVKLTPHYIFNKVTDLTNYCKTTGGDSTQCPTYVQNKYFTSVEECKKAIAQNVTACLDEKSYLKSSSGVFYSSLHGRQEGNQNVREICAWNQVGENKKVWWEFVGLVNKNCTAQNADTCWEQQGKEAGLDTNKITECFNQDAFKLIENEIAITSQFKVSGSPTVFINDAIFPPENAYTADNKGSLLIDKKLATQDKYRTPNVIKTAICASMDKPDKLCTTALPELNGNAPSVGGCSN